MSLTEPAAIIIAALITTPPGVWLTLRTRNAKRDALEQLVAKAVATKDVDHKQEIARNDKAHAKEVEWLQGQILYYQQMSAPVGQRPARRPL